jgi:hypothetical protein
MIFIGTTAALRCGCADLLFLRNFREKISYNTLYNCKNYNILSLGKPFQVRHIENGVGSPRWPSRVERLVGRGTPNQKEK